MTYGTKLRERIAGPGTTPLIGVYDMYSASIAAQHYDGMFVSGFGFAASYYGLPDIGFIAWPDMMAFVQRLRGAFPGHHLLVDIDDGYVDPEVACHVVEGLERIGASGVILEDQKRPRRCGHADGKQVLPLHEYLAKLEMVLATRGDLVVVARTDATDEKDILHRAETLAATAADVVLVDGVRSVEWIRRIRAVVGDKPLLFNQIAGGKSPRLSLSELSDLGVDVAIYSTPCLFAAHEAMHSALTELKRADGRLPTPDATNGVGVATATRLLEGNIAHRRPAAENVAQRTGTGDAQGVQNKQETGRELETEEWDKAVTASL
ncbi:isocitrate lyase/PEP mutase family protein [Streptomyces scabiei]|uniref:isocitrate lyase/PEP mutase family protein n=1 Tax=Streptomyces scabiei TaxID=1930 RepID=UPI0029BB8E7A|nr:isocitrate lyase/PEP mutase family protein [Streptomyces scabiei]MDX3112803.1 isocitrate lyase/PEP mutase family protein [Streptomyces scabiei]